MKNYSVVPLRGRKGPQPVCGVHAPAPRLTKTAAFLVALALSVPVFVVASVLEILL